MKKIVQVSLLIILVFTLGLRRYDPRIHDEISKDQLEAFVKEAVAFVKIYGSKEAKREFSKSEGLFNRGELYIYAYNYNCKVVAHGHSPAMVGKDLSELQDPDGVLIVKEMVKIIKKNGKGWLRYKWFHPKTNKITVKIGYFEKVDNNWWLGSGYYLQ